MNKKLQNLAWGCLPKEVRDKIISVYFCKTDKSNTMSEYSKGYINALIQIYGEHNLTSNSEPEEMLMVPRYKVVVRYEDDKDVANTTRNEDTRLLCEARMNLLANLFGDKCLPDKEEPHDDSKEIIKNIEDFYKTANENELAEVNEAFSTEIEGDIDINEYLNSAEEQLKPKFKVGNIVTNEYNNLAIYTIEAVHSNPWGFTYSLEGDRSRYHESHLSLYIPEAFKRYVKEGEDSKLLPDNLDSEAISSLDQELNLCELLKDCEGERFYSPAFGVIKLISIDNTKDTKPMYWDLGLSRFYSYADGRIYIEAIPLIFPNCTLYEKYPLDPYSAWMEWKDSKKWIPEIGERIFWVNANLTVSQDRFNDYETQRKRRAVGNEFKTGKEAEQAAEIIKKTIQELHNGKAN